MRTLRAEEGEGVRSPGHNDCTTPAVSDAKSAARIAPACDYRFASPNLHIVPRRRSNRAAATRPLSLSPQAHPTHPGPQAHRAPVAQRIEQVPSKHLAAGSSPAGGARSRTLLREGPFCWSGVVLGRGSGGRRGHPDGWVCPVESGRRRSLAAGSPESFPKSSGRPLPCLDSGPRAFLCRRVPGRMAVSCPSTPEGGQERRTGCGDAREEAKTATRSCGVLPLKVAHRGYGSPTAGSAHACRPDLPGPGSASRTSGALPPARCRRRVRGRGRRYADGRCRGPVPGHRPPRERSRGCRRRRRVPRERRGREGSRSAPRGGRRW